VGNLCTNILNIKHSVFTNRVYFCVLQGSRPSIVSCTALTVFFHNRGIELCLLCGTGCILNTNRVDSDL